MTYEVYRSVFQIGAIGCGVMAVVSVILFFWLQIPKVIGDLTGHTARRAISDIRRQNEDGVHKTYKSSAVNLQRGKTTDKISHSGRVVPVSDGKAGTSGQTERIGGAPETDGNETTVLEEETLSLETMALPHADGPVFQKFEVEFEITYLHSNEVVSVEGRS